jgi:hypothetical protein
MNEYCTRSNSKYYFLIRRNGILLIWSSTEFRIIIILKLQLRQCVWIISYLNHIKINGSINIYY